MLASAGLFHFDANWSVFVRVTLQLGYFGSPLWFLLEIGNMERGFACILAHVDSLPENKNDILDRSFLSLADHFYLAFLPHLCLTGLFPHKEVCKVCRAENCLPLL